DGVPCGRWTAYVKHALSEQALPPRLVIVYNSVPTLSLPFSWPVPAVELLEREQCFADLHDWLTGSVEQGGCVTLVHGEAGIGKTALLQEFSRQQKVAPRVLWGACDALFTPRPLAPLHDIARQTQGKLLAALHAETSRDAIFSAALDEL